MLRITRIGCTIAVALLLVPTMFSRLATAQQAAAQDDKQRFIELITDLDDAGQQVAVLHEALAAEAPGKYWIGLRCSNVEGALRAQLGLPQGKGLLVDELMPDSPAKKAGMEQYDVLLKFGERELTAVNDLVEAVQKAEKTEVSVSLLRAGKPLTVKVTPAERDVSASPARIAVVAEPDVNYEQLHSLIEKLQKSGPQGELGPQGDLRWQVLRPHVRVSKKQISALPKGMTISITKSGEEEAKIVVQRGDEKWEATEKSLDKLPEDVRKAVEQFLGARAPGVGGVGLAAPPGAVGWSSRFSVNSAGSPLLSPVAGGKVAGGAILAPDRTQKQLDEIKKQLEELRKAVESLQTKKE